MLKLQIEIWSLSFLQPFLTCVIVVVEGYGIFEGRVFMVCTSTYLPDSSLDLFDKDDTFKMTH